MNIPFLVYHNLQFEQPHPSNISAVMTFFQVRRRSGSSNSPTSSVSVSSSSSSSGSTFKVAVRVRPLLEKERKELALQCVSVELDHNAVVIKKPEQRKRIPSHIEVDNFSDLVQSESQNGQNFFFDTVFSPSASQEEVYCVCAKHIILSTLEGYNGSLIAYGQTGTGKSYTIEGGNTAETRGIIPRASEDVFSYIRDTASIRDRFLVRVSFLEIYNEKISDLLDPSRSNLRIREDGAGGMYVENLSEHVVKSTEEIKSLIKQGAHLRTTAATRMNVESSRSHAIFTIILEHAQSTDDGGNVVTIGKLRLADLAGSERFDTESQQKRQEETKHINVSLHTFGKVIMCLTSSSAHTHIPYRDSKLTKILQDSLGGNCKTTLITTITPTATCYTESLNSLNFAKRAKHVKNTAIINKDVSQKALLSAYQQEIKKLREQLQSQGDSVNSDELLQLQREKATAEREKHQVLSELEQQKMLYSKAEQDKLNYQKQIEKLEEMLIQGGSSVDNSTQFKQAIEEERERIAMAKEQEYREKFAKLEEEKKRLEKEKKEMEKEREMISKLKADMQPEKNNLPLHNNIRGEATPTNSRPNLPRPSLASRKPGSSKSATPPPKHPLMNQGSFSSMPSLPQHQQTFNLPPQMRTSGGNFPIPQRRPSRTSTLGLPISPVPSLYDSRVQVALKQYYQALADPVSGIPCQELQSGVRIFTGKDAVEWFRGNMEGVTSPEEALKIGKRLIDLGMIAEIQGSNEFLASDGMFYQFLSYSSTNPYSFSSSSRPSSGLSMVSLPTGYPLIMQPKTVSMPAVNKSSAWDFSSSLSSSPSLATLQLSSPSEMMNNHGLTLNNPTPLHMAAISGDCGTANELSQSYDINARDGEGYTPLMYAAIGNQMKCCSVLVKHLGANPDLQNQCQLTALMLAVMNDNSEVAKVLLKNGAETKITDQTGNNVFHLAAKNSRTRCLQVLAKYALNLVPINKRNNNLQSPLHVAVLSNQHNNITVLLRAKCDLGISDREGRTALHYAVLEMNAECLQCIVTEAPNDVNLVDIKGQSALHITSSLGMESMTKLLLESPKCDVNICDNEGRTPLHLAVLGNHSQIVKILLQSHADPTVCDESNKTAQEYAYEKNYLQCIKTFSNFQAKQ